MPRRSIHLPHIAALLLLFACSTGAIESTATSYGTFDLCVRRLSDSCVTDGGTCRTDEARLRQTSLAIRPDGTLLWSRDGLAPLTGRQVGARFEIRGETASLEGLCGCTARVTEVIRGELLEAPADTLLCTPSTDAGTTTSCGADAGRPALYFDGPLPSDDWLDASPDAGPRSDVPYAGVRALVTNEVTPANGEPCDCVPCALALEVGGRK